jgi:hypothetical protein
MGDIHPEPPAGGGRPRTSRRGILKLVSEVGPPSGRLLGQIVVGLFVAVVGGVETYNLTQPDAKSKAGAVSAPTPTVQIVTVPVPSSTPQSTSTTATTSTTTTTSTTATPPGEGTRTPNLFAESGSPATGIDAHGYNDGPGCSDDPASPRPGCNDSPSVPVGHPSGECANGITIDRQTTSCGLAENVYAGYTGDGPVTALSPERGRDYTFTCKTPGAGTTGYTICLGRAGSSPLYLRWHPR